MITKEYMTFADFDLYNCPLCDNVTPCMYCEDCMTGHCQYCFDAYGCDGCE